MGGLLFGTRWAWFGHIINAELKKACLFTELPPMRSHGFRHAMGTHLPHAGCSIRHIQSLLGRRHLKDLKAVIDRCHPRKWKGPDGA